MSNVSSSTKGRNGMFNPRQHSRYNVPPNSKRVELAAKSYHNVYVNDFSNRRAKHFDPSTSSRNRKGARNAAYSVDKVLVDEVTARRSRVQANPLSKPRFARGGQIRDNSNLHSSSQVTGKSASSRRPSRAYSQPKQKRVINVYQNREKGCKSSFSNQMGTLL